MERIVEHASPNPISRRRTIDPNPFDYIDLNLNNTPLMAWFSPIGDRCFVAWGQRGSDSFGRKLDPEQHDVPWLVGGFPFAPSPVEPGVCSWKQGCSWRPRGAVEFRKDAIFQHYGEAADDVGPSSEGLSWQPSEWAAEPSREVFERGVHDAVTAIEDGLLDKVVLARSVVARSARPFSVGATARAMRAAYPNATTYVVALPNQEVLCGATPELVAHVHDGWLRTQAVAGTGAHDTLWSSHKDRHEHQLVVDDIRRVLRDMGLHPNVAAQPEVVPSGPIAHLVTPIEARLPPGLGVLDVVAQLHPTAALAGAPREPAMRWIRENEHIDRGWYGGPVGWADAAGNGTFVVALRCALFSEARHVVRCFGGAGIVSQSNAALEHDETEAKMRAAQRCLRVEQRS